MLSASSIATERPTISICQPIRASGRSIIEARRHLASLQSTERSIRLCWRRAHFEMVTVLSGTEDSSGHHMALACREMAERLQLPHTLLSSPAEGKPAAVNSALNYAWGRSDIALMLDDDITFPLKGIGAILDTLWIQRNASHACFLKTALGPSFYDETPWTQHLAATHLSFLPPVIATLVRYHPDFYSFVPTGSAYATLCEGAVLQLPDRCNEADLIVRSDYALTGLSVGSWFGSARQHEVERRKRQISDGVSGSDSIAPRKATRFLDVPRDLEATLSKVFGPLAGRDISSAVRHTSSIMEDTYNPMADVNLHRLRH
jgi:hypothetical protein